MRKSAKKSGKTRLFLVEEKSVFVDTVIASIDKRLHSFDKTGK